jgi:hypothetical protein
MNVITLFSLKKKFYKWEVLCLFNTRVSQKFITRESAKRMELKLEKLKAPIEVHFADRVPHPTTL